MAILRLFAHVRGKAQGHFRQKTRHALLRGQVCALKIQFDGNSEELFSRVAAHIISTSVIITF